jgi:hypothetical protein
LTPDEVDYGDAGGGRAGDLHVPGRGFFKMNHEPATQARTRSVSRGTHSEIAHTPPLAAEPTRDKSISARVLMHGGKQLPLARAVSDNASKRTTGAGEDSRDASVHPSWSTSDERYRQKLLKAGDSRHGTGDTSW